MKPKRTKVATGISIDCVTPHSACITYPDGSKKWVYDCFTEEDIKNYEGERKWMENQLRKIG